MCFQSWIHSRVWNCFSSARMTYVMFILFWTDLAMFWRRCSDCSFFYSFSFSNVSLILSKFVFNLDSTFPYFFFNSDKFSYLNTISWNTNSLFYFFSLFGEDFALMGFLLMIFSFKLNLTFWSSYSISKVSLSKVNDTLNFETFLETRGVAFVLFESTDSF